MTASIDPLSLVLILGSAQCLFLALVFWRADRGNRKADRLLAVFFLVLPLANLNGVLYRAELYTKLPFLIGLEPAARLFMGPVFYLYVEALVDSSRRLRRDMAIGLGGALLLSTLCVSFILKDPVYKMLFVQVWLWNGGYTAGEYFGTFWYELVIELQVWIYLILIWNKVLRYEALIRDAYSSIDSITLAWIRKVIIAFALALAASTGSYVLFTFGIKFRYVYLLSPLAAVFSAYYISYKAFHQPDVFLIKKPVLSEDVQGPSRRKYEKSGVSDDESSLLLERLERTMRARRPYIDSELTLSKLSTLLSTSNHRLSQLLNQRLQTCFYDYINRYRVEEVKRCLADRESSDSSILDIALECGFNSKSTFNKIFKQHTSLSPTQYRERAAKVARPPLTCGG
jgi:AraC-like DNA-binding protein